MSSSFNSFKGQVSSVEVKRHLSVRSIKISSVGLNTGSESYADAITQMRDFRYKDLSSFSPASNFTFLFAMKKKERLSALKVHLQFTLPMIPHFRHSRTYFHQISNTRRQLTSFTSIVPIQRNVICEETRKFSTVVCYMDHSKEKLLNAVNLRHLTSQIYTVQSFCSSSESGRFNDSRRSEREARTLFVAGLSMITTEDSLRQYFIRKSWNVTDCRIIRDKMTGASLQYGYVEFESVKEAELASTERFFIDCKVVRVQMSGHKELDDKYRIFVGGLLKETSRETLHNHFSQFGDIFACGIYYNEDNLSRGFGSVTYKSQDSVDRALNSQPHSIDNTVVDVKHATIRPKDLTMFVGSLSPKTTDESLCEYFSKYGQLSECYVNIDRKTGLSRGFGHVNFKSKEDLESARSEYPHTIDGVKVIFHSKGQNLVVDSLSPNITIDSLQEFFSQYGQVQDCRIATNSVRTTTAYVIMSNEEEISRALADRPHYINEKLVFTHLKGQAFGIRLFDIPKSVTDDDLYETFSKVGKLVHWEVMRDRKYKTNRSLGFAYLAFSSAEDVDRVMDRQPYSIHGTMLTIQRRLWEGRKKQ